jgi:hypothetical protein
MCLVLKLRFCGALPPLQLMSLGTGRVEGPGFVDLEAYTILGPSLRKKYYKNYEYKITYEN